VSSTPGTPIVSRRAVVRPYGLCLKPRAIHTCAFGFSTTRPSFATTRKLKRTGHGEKSPSPGVRATVFSPGARDKASNVPGRRMIESMTRTRNP
jgi:hypothetical protein